MRPPIDLPVIVLSLAGFKGIVIAWGAPFLRWLFVGVRVLSKGAP